jgi:hypothetical protein
MALENIVNAAKSALKDVVSSPSADPISDRDEVLQDLHLAEKAWATDGVHSGVWFVRDGDAKWGDTDDRWSNDELHSR